MQHLVAALVPFEDLRVLEDLEEVLEEALLFLDHLHILDELVHVHLLALFEGHSHVAEGAHDVGDREAVLFGLVLFVISLLLWAGPDLFQRLVELLLDLERALEVFAGIPEPFLFRPRLHVPIVLVVPIRFAVPFFATGPFQVLRLEAMEFSDERSVRIEDPELPEGVFVGPFAQAAVDVELVGIDVVIPLDPFDVAGHVDAHPLVLVLPFIEDPEDGLEATVQNAGMDVELEELRADALVHFDLAEGFPASVAPPEPLDVPEARAEVKTAFVQFVLHRFDGNGNVHPFLDVLQVDRDGVESGSQMIDPALGAERPGSVLLTMGFGVDEVFPPVVGDVHLDLGRFARIRQEEAVLEVHLLHEVELLPERGPCSGDDKVHVASTRIDDRTLHLVVLDVGIAPLIELDIPDDIVRFPSGYGLLGQVRVAVGEASEALFFSGLAFEPIGFPLPGIAGKVHEGVPFAVDRFPIHLEAPGMECCQGRKEVPLLGLFSSDRGKDHTFLFLLLERIADPAGVDGMGAEFDEAVEAVLDLGFDGGSEKDRFTDVPIPIVRSELPAVDLLAFHGGVEGDLRFRGLKVLS